jgi:AraC family transcriptional regulator of adaptative response/methylated-DNA-[protein]-cysteine methyltransferase
MTTLSDPSSYLDLTSTDRWQAVMGRDSHYDNIFVYGVRSTGIYCLPSCPSRRPKPENVTFFPTPDLAEKAGFRSCRRCHPKQFFLNNSHTQLVKNICQYIHSRDTSPTLTELSHKFSISPSHLHRIFKRITGITPRQYSDAHRFKQLKLQLKERGNVMESIYEAGYGSSRRLYEQSYAQLGMTPASYQHGGHGATITYSITDCHLGRLLVAATHKGICAICLGDEDETLKNNLFKEFPKAQINQDNNQWLKESTDQILKHLNGNLPSLDLALDIQATAFQRHVWKKLMEIPYGVTHSYQQVAKAIGQPKAVRAVANACGANPVALAIPCHRVVRSDGSLGGYRWGIERKKALLAREKTTIRKTKD